jgi:hypothetical protein
MPLTSNRWPLVRLRQLDFVADRLAKALELSAPEFCGHLLKKVDRNSLQRQPDLDQGELGSVFRLLGVRHSVDHNPEPAQKLIKIMFSISMTSLAPEIKKVGAGRVPVIGDAIDPFVGLLDHVLFVYQFPQQLKPCPHCGQKRPGCIPDCAIKIAIVHHFTDSHCHLTPCHPVALWSPPMWHGI